MAKYPEITVQLTDRDGNSFVLIRHVRYALKKAGLPPKVQSRFFEEAVSGNYDHTLRTCKNWVTIE